MSNPMKQHIEDAVDLSDEACRQRYAERWKNDKTRLSYWFPKIQAAGLPVPKTSPIIEMTYDEFANAVNTMGDDVEPKEVLAFVERVKVEADKIGYPCFLRTDYTAGKHDWKDSCYIASSDKILDCVLGIIQYSECASIVGLPCDRWVVRELLPVDKYGVCKKYSNMPIAKEFRCFVDGRNVKCKHPYWPLDALERGGVVWGKDKTYEALCYIAPNKEPVLDDLAERAGVAVGGEWSVDIVYTSRGLYIIDMAEAHKSFHWKGCPNNPEKDEHEE